MKNLRTLYLDAFKNLVVKGHYASIEHKTLDGCIYRMRFTKEALLHLLLKLCSPADPRPDWPYVQDPAQSDRYGQSFPFTIFGIDCYVTIVSEHGTPVAEAVCPKVQKVYIRLEPSDIQCLGEHLVLYHKGRVSINKQHAQKMLDFMNAEATEDECGTPDIYSYYIERLERLMERLELSHSKLDQLLNTILIQPE